MLFSPRLSAGEPRIIGQFDRGVNSFGVDWLRDSGKLSLRHRPSPEESSVFFVIGGACAIPLHFPT